MSAREWPSREEWQAAAAYSVRTFCMPHERVSDRIGDYLNAEERAELADMARHARTALFRVAKAASDPDATITRLDVHAVRVVVRRLDDLAAARDAAAAEATKKAVAREIAWRQTDDAWERELQHRQRCDRDPLIRRTLDQDAEQRRGGGTA